MSQCLCIARSTGEQCLNIPKKGSSSPFCHFHQECKQRVGEVAPPRKLVSPPRKLVSPPRKLVSPPRKLVSPPRKLAAPVPSRPALPPISLVALAVPVPTAPAAPRLASPPKKASSPPKKASSPPKKAVEQEVLLPRNLFIDDLRTPVYRQRDDGIPVLSDNMRKVWSKYKDDPKTLIALNELWWNTEGAHHLQNLFTNGFYDRDEIIEGNPLADLIVTLNKYIITTDSHDDSPQQNLEPIKLYGLPIQKGYYLQRPYIRFYVDNELGKKLIKNMNKIDDYLWIEDPMTKDKDGFLSNVAADNANIRGINFIIDPKDPGTLRNDDYTPVTFEKSKEKINTDLHLNNMGGIFGLPAHLTPAQQQQAKLVGMDALPVSSDATLIHDIIDKHFLSANIESSRAPRLGVRDNLMERLLNIILSIQ